MSCPSQTGQPWNSWADLSNNEKEESIMQTVLQSTGQSSAAPSKMSSLQRAPVSHSIGAILVDAGKLTPEKAESVLRLQKEKHLPFGEAAIKLGLLSPEDVRFALA